MEDNDKLKKQIELQQQIRRQQGRFTPNEIAEKCIELLKTKPYLILDDEFPKADKNNIEKAVYDVTKSPKYTLDTTPYNKRWLIKRNPGYRNELWHDAKVTLLAAGLALLTGYILWLIDSQSKNRETERVNHRLEQVERRLDSLAK